jgi:hypothetical protein
VGLGRRRRGRHLDRRAERVIAAITPAATPDLVPRAAASGCGSPPKEH